MSENLGKMAPFMRLFWEQQKQISNIKPLSSNDYLILFVACFQAASAYVELSSSNVLTLPSCRTLRDYKNAIKPHAGYNPAVIQKLIKTTELFTGHQRNIIVIR